MKERTETGHYVYGPVPSRRLGLSLGVDLLPYKTCSFNCIYCQLGTTERHCLERSVYHETQTVLAQVQEALSRKQRIDYITFSGSGEPTLHSDIGLLIRRIKDLTDIPVAVITNSSLLHEKSVRESLLPADLVVPSLDAGREATFLAINRPHPAVRFDEMVSGLARFSREFRGTLWLEIMLVAGMNDNNEELEALRLRLKKMRIDKIQLNSVFRPPADTAAVPVKPGRLASIRDLFGERAYVVTDFRGTMQQPLAQRDEARIMELISRRPATVSDIVAALGIHRNEVVKCLSRLEKQHRAKSVQHEERRYYEPL